MIRDEVVKLIAHWHDMPELAHPVIIKGYNARKPLPRGYALKDSDAWCAATVSEVLSECWKDNPFREVSAQKLYDQLVKAFGFEYSTEYIRPGDIVFYDWNNNGTKDHVGVVTCVSDAYVEVHEGNVNGKMGKRVFSPYEVVNGCKTPVYIPIVYPDEVPKGEANATVITPNIAKQILNYCKAIEKLVENL